MADTCYFPPAHYLNGAFKGVSLGQVLECDSEHGRRGAEGEFPFGEQTDYVDLGRRIRRFRIKSQFPKSTHIADANALIAACESPYVGTLVHPTRGPVTAACKMLKVTDQPQEAAGVTFIDMEFVEGPSGFAELGAGALLGMIGLGLSDLAGAVQIYFADNFDFDAAPFYDLESGISATAAVVATVADGFSAATGFSSDPAIARIRNDLASVAAMPDVLRTPAKAWQAISNGIAAIDRFGTSPSARMAALKGVINSASLAASASPVVLTNTVATTARVLGAAYYANAAAALPRGTPMQRVCAYYDQVLLVLREEAAIANAACNDALYLALNDFTVTAQTALLQRVISAPVVVRYDFHGGVFSVVAAHEIYGDGRRANDIEDMNPTAPPFHIGPIVQAVPA